MMQPADRRRSASLTDDGRYRLLVEAIQDYAIYMLDNDGAVVSWNPGAERFKGYTSDEIVGQHFSRFYTAEDRAAGIPQLALRRARTEGRFEAEGWRVRKDGTRFWALVVIDAIRNPAGDVIGFAKITRDLTERRQSELKLRQAQEQFRLLVQGVTDYAIYMLNPVGTITSWNAGAERIKGYRPQEIIGAHFSKFYTAEDQKSNEPQNALASARKEGRFEKEGWRVRKDGTRFWAHVVIDTVRDDAGNFIGFAKITRDITERKKAQEELEKAREGFFQSQKMEALGQLTGGIAHDFNNLLMAVLSSLELMRKRLPDDPKLLALWDNAVQGANRGTSLTQRMLAFARLQDLDRKALDIPHLIRGMRDFLQRSLGPSITLETRFPLMLKSVMADANQLEMALLNLVVNARDAMPDGGHIIVAASEIVASAEDAKGLKPGRYVCLTVRDSGFGMDPETSRRATEPFFTTKGPGKGTGLGLSMVHGLAEQSGGKLILSSELGKGTTAQLCLPIADQEPNEVPAPQTEDDQPFRSFVILAVDDDPLVLLNTASMLEELGHTVHAAYSGKQALGILKAHPEIEVLITDHAMPNMTGLQLAMEIAKERPDLPVIVATGYAELGSAEGRALRKLAKPFTEVQLAAELSRLSKASAVSAGRHCE